MPEKGAGFPAGAGDGILPLFFALESLELATDYLLRDVCDVCQVVVHDLPDLVVDLL
jgi:hypothetical protein